MRHAISAARLFAGASALAGGTADQTGREFRITIVRPGQSVETYTRWYADSMDATWDAIERGGDGARVQVRPFLEVTFGEGRLAFPFELHPEATAAAHAGWQAAKVEAERRPSYRMALLQQANQITQLQASTL